MVHAYCEIRDSWTGWLRGSAMSRTLHERIVPEMRALRDVERRIVDQPSVTLLAVLDYAARARQAVPAYTPLATIDHPQPPVPDTVREACERMIAEAEKAALAARRAGAREYAARMAYAIEREREEEARRRRAMKEAGVTETPAEAEAAAAASTRGSRSISAKSAASTRKPTSARTASQRTKRSRRKARGSKSRRKARGSRSRRKARGSKSRRKARGSRSRRKARGSRSRLRPPNGRPLRTGSPSPGKSTRAGGAERS